MQNGYFSVQVQMERGVQPDVTDHIEIKTV